METIPICYRQLCENCVKMGRGGASPLSPRPYSNTHTCGDFQTVHIESDAHIDSKHVSTPDLIVTIIIVH